MSFLSNIINFLILSSLLACALSRPVEEDFARIPRQVVQPAWLTKNENIWPQTDGKVHVTKEKLQEISSLRKSIQDAIDDGIYAVDISMSSSSSSSSLSLLMSETTSTTTSMPNLNNFNIFGDDIFPQTQNNAWNDFLANITQLFSSISN